METVQLPPQAGQTVASAHAIFGPRLIGACLYGSATLRGLRPDSDLDILLTLDGRVGEGERRALTRTLLTLSVPPGTPGRRPLEVTVVDRNILLEDVFPPAYEYQFGEWLRPDIERGNLPARRRPGPGPPFLAGAEPQPAPFRGTGRKADSAGPVQQGPAGDLRGAALPFGKPARG